MTFIQSMLFFSHFQDVAKYLAVGSYTRTIPHSPEVPSSYKLEWMWAIPQAPDRKAKIHFFTCESEENLK